MEWWHALLASPVLVAAVPLFRRAFDWYTADRAEKSVQRSRKIYQTLNEAQYRLNSDRILVISAHNCGGPLRPDVLMYVDALYEVVADLEPRLERIVNVRIDHYMVGLLDRLIKEGVTWTPKKEIPPGSYVANMYETDGVNQACSFLIRVEDKQVLYGVIHYKREHVPCAQEADAVATLRTTLTTLLK